MNRIDQRDKRLLLVKDERRMDRSAQMLGGIMVAFAGLIVACLLGALLMGCAAVEEKQVRVHVYHYYEPEPEFYEPQELIEI